MKCKQLQVILTTLLKVYVRGGLFEKSRDLLSELEAMGYADDEVLLCFISFVKVYIPTLDEDGFYSVLLYCLFLLPFMFRCGFIL